jgi:hypothetical protein
VDLPPGSQSYGEGDRCLVFVPGFLVAATAYRSLLSPVAAAGARVVVPQLTRPGPAALAGRVPPAHEADRLLQIISGLRGPHDRLWIGGHSRGGLVAWLASAAVDPDGLVLVDPVSGGGPPWAPVAPLPARTFQESPVVIGLGDGGRCAPADRGHRVFASAAPGCTHIVIPDAGHADVLDGRSARLGRVLCAPGVDPAATRRAVTELLVTSVCGEGSANSDA